MSWILRCSDVRTRTYATHLACSSRGHERLIGRGIDLEAVVKLQLTCHFAHRRDDFLAHQPNTAHGVVVGHRTVAVPEEDVARAQRLEYVANLRNHSFWRSGDDRHAVELALILRVARGAFLWRLGWLDGQARQHRRCDSTCDVAIDILSPARPTQFEHVARG